MGFDVGWFLGHREVFLHDLFCVRSLDILCGDWSAGACDRISSLAIAKGLS